MRNSSLFQPLLFLAVVVVVHATDYYVSITTGSDSNSGTEEKPFKTVDKAFKEAKTGDNIMIMSGAYPASGNVGSVVKDEQKNISFIGVGDPQSVVFNLANSPAPFFTVQDSGGGYFTFEGLVFQNSAQAGSIFDINAGNSTFFRDCVFSSLGVESQDPNSHAVSVQGVETVIFEGCFFRENSGNTGGTVLWVSEFTSLLLNQTQFIQNRASVNGGTLNVQTSAISATVTLIDCLFEENFCGDDGGAISVNSSLSISMSNSVFIGNAASQGDSNSAKGGGVYFSSEVEVAIFNSTFNSNSAGFGGAIYAEKSFMSLTQSTLNENEVSSDGGGLFLGAGSLQSMNGTFKLNTVGGKGGAISMGSVDPGFSFTILDTIFEENEAEGNGGGIHLSGQGIIGNSFFLDNQAKNGGGLYVASSNLFSTSTNVFSGNSVLQKGGAVFINQKSSSALFRDQIFNNYAENKGGGLYFHEIQHPVLVALADFTNNTAGAEGYHMAGDIDDVNFGNKFQVVQITKSTMDQIGPSDIYAKSSNFVFDGSCDLPTIKQRGGSHVFVCGCDTGEIYSLDLKDAEFFTDSDIKLDSSANWLTSTLSSVNTDECLRGQSTENPSDKTTLTIKGDITVKQDDESGVVLNKMTLICQSELSVQPGGSLEVYGKIKNKNTLIISEGASVKADEVYNDDDSIFHLESGVVVAATVTMEPKSRIDLRYEDDLPTASTVIEITETASLAGECHVLLNTTEDDPLELGTTLVVLKWNAFSGSFESFNSSMDVEDKTEPVYKYSPSDLTLDVVKLKKDHDGNLAAWLVPVLLVVLIIVGVAAFFIVRQQKGSADGYFNIQE